MRDDEHVLSTPQPGELLAVPPLASWKALLQANMRAACSWDFEVAGSPFAEVRRTARAEALSAALSFTSRMEGVFAPLTPQPVGEGPIVMTGHQPELFHPGVWVKDFLVDRFASRDGATGIDLVVDSDGFETVEASAPCMKPEVHRCTATLAVAAKDACFACTPPPNAGQIDAFCERVESMLATLSSDEPAANFAAFCGSLRRASKGAINLAELITFARRSYEAVAGTTYLELPVTVVGHSKAFASFALDIATSAERFVDVYNSELAAYRDALSVRSKAQPFPDLERVEGRCELPFWVLGEGRRATLWALCAEDGSARLWADGEEIGRFAHDEPGRFAETACAAVLAPKALTLTLFARVFLSDLFVHGTGGARYDRVTDGVIRRYWGIEPPGFVVASLTERLELGVDLVTEEEVAKAVERANRFVHNPDAMLDEARFDDARQQARAEGLAAEKSEAVRAIARPGADKKALGMRIRELNEALRQVMPALGEELKAEASRLEAARRDAEVLEDRTYPFCYFDPRAIAEIAG